MVDAAFPTPGEAALRNIRVQTFIRSWGIDAVRRHGSTPWTSTADRFEQDVLPNLELIREKGFTEPTQESFNGARDGCEIGDVLQAAAPAFEDWFALVGPLARAVQGTLDDPGLTALKAPMADCLRTATGLAVSDRDPASSFVGAWTASTPRAGARPPRPTPTAGRMLLRRLDAAAARPAAGVRRQHRALLERFAAQLATLGYAP